jgi:hypothetical protein
MVRSWGNERTVASVLADKNYYPTDPNASDEQLQAQMIEEEQVTIGGKSYTLSRLSMYDAKLFADQLDNIASRLNPFIWDIYAKYAVQCLAALRLANVNSKQGFRGIKASGNELDFTTMIAREFYDPDNSTNSRTTWVRAIGSTGQKNIIEGTASGAALTLGEEECDIYLAWYNPAQTPCIDATQVILNTNAMNVHTMDFDQVNTEFADPIIEFKAPLIVPPEEAYEILAYYFQTGTDETRPIGLRFREAKYLRDLTDVNTD